MPIDLVKGSSRQKASCKIPFCEWRGDTRARQEHLARSHGIGSRRAQRHRAEAVKAHIGKGGFASFEDALRHRSVVEGDRIHLTFTFKSLKVSSFNLRDYYRELVVDGRLPKERGWR